MDGTAASSGSSSRGPSTLTFAKFADCSLVTVHCLACCFNALSGRLLQDRALLQAFCLIDVILCGLLQEETEWFRQVCIIQPMGIFGMRLLARNVANDPIY